MSPPPPPFRSITSANAIIRVPSVRSDGSPLNQDPHRRNDQDDVDDDDNNNVPRLFFFITGNPGLIGYYREYLDLLACHDDGNDDSRNTSVGGDSNGHGHGVNKNGSEDRGRRVYYAGFSLGGFELDDDGASLRMPQQQQRQPLQQQVNDEYREDGINIHDFLHPPDIWGAPFSGDGPGGAAGDGEEEKPCKNNRHPSQLYGLRDQIELCYARLRYLCHRISEDEFSRDESRDLSSSSLPSSINEREETTTSSVGSSSAGGAATQRAKIKVILAGHSVGAYIALEMVRLHHERPVAVQRRQSKQHDSMPPPTHESKLPTKQANYALPGFQIISCLLLTPTILNLAQSRSGRIAGPVLSNIPYFPSMVHFVSRVLTATATSILPSSLSPFFPSISSHLEWIVRKVTGMKEGSSGLQSTVAFLKSTNGVRQALHMAADELREMRENRWGSEVWGDMKVEGGDTSDTDTDTDTDTDKNPDKNNTEGNSDPDLETMIDRSSSREPAAKWKAPKLFFLFAKQDHWVADETRAEIISILQHIKERRRRRRRQARIERPTLHPHLVPEGLECQQISNSDMNDENDNAVVMIDQDHGLVHAWCLTQTEIVADLSRKWIRLSLSK